MKGFKQIVSLYYILSHDFLLIKDTSLFPYSPKTFQFNNFRSFVLKVGKDIISVIRGLISYLCFVFQGWVDNYNNIAGFIVAVSVWHIYF